MSDESTWFTDDEAKSLILALIGAASPEGVSERRIIAWVRWCELQRAGAALIDLVLQGQLEPIWHESEHEPRFQARSSRCPLVDGRPGSGPAST